MEKYPIKNLMWMGGGFTGVAYYTGVIQQLLIEERTGNTQIDFVNLRHFGNSAGNGCMLAYELMRTDTIERQKQLLDTIIDVLGNRSGGYFEATKFMFELVEQCALHPHSDKDIVAISNKSLHIGMVRKNPETNNLESFYESKFTSRADILNAILCGGNIPIVCSHQAKCRGADCVDGGLLGFTSETCLLYGLMPENTIAIHPPVKFPFSIGEYPRWIFQMIREYGAIVNDLTKPSDISKFQGSGRGNILHIVWLMRGIRQDPKWNFEIDKWKSSLL